MAKKTDGKLTGDNIAFWIFALMIVVGTMMMVLAAGYALTPGLP